MKKSFVIIAAIVMMVGFTSRVMAQPGVSDTKSNNANAQILGAIALTAVNPLEFGGIVASTGGTVKISTAGVRSSIGALTLVSGTVTPSAASYTVTGTELASYAITIPIIPVIVTNTSVGGGTMNVTAMDCSYGTLLSAFDVAGADNFTVGGTLTVGAAQIPGLYTGTFDVTVAY